MRWLAAVLWVLVAVPVVVRATPADTDRRRLHAGPLRRAVRRMRARAVSFVAALLGWPHVVDLALGAGRVPVGQTLHSEVWRSGSARLVRYQGVTPSAHHEPVVLVHSTVSQPWILDLTPTRSLVRSLLDAGFDVFLLDWGAPSDGRLGLADHARLLRAAERAVLDMAQAPRLHRVGYCFAASLSLYDLAHEQAPYLASCVLIAPVADFDAPGGFRTALANPWVRPVLALDGDGCVPAAVVREAFHGLRPQAVKTMWTRIRHRRSLDAEYRQFYAAMATWAWTHRRMPGALLFDVVDLYRANPLLDRLGRVDLDLPVLVVIAERDHIVPAAASHALQRVLDVDVLSTPAGHVSMIVGSAAHTSVWPGIAAWLAARAASAG